MLFIYIYIYIYINIYDKYAHVDVCIDIQAQYAKIPSQKA